MRVHRGVIVLVFPAREVMVRPLLPPFQIEYTEGEFWLFRIYSGKIAFNEVNSG